MAINSVSISGNLTRDPELRRTQSGMAIMTIGVAVNDRRKNAQGEWEDVPNFVDCTMFGQRAEGICGYLSKGLKVAIEGKLRYSSWEKDGQKRSKLEVIIDEIEWFQAKQQQGYAPPAPQQVGYQQQMAAQGVAQMQQANMQYQQMAQPQYAPMPQPQPIPNPNYGQMPVTQAVPQAVANVTAQQPQYAPQQYQQPPQPQPMPQPSPQPAQMQMPPQPVADASIYDDDIPF